MITAPIVFFALAALAGLTMAYLFISGKGVPFFIPIVHGLSAVTGLVLLIITWLQTQTGALVYPIIVFALAATGGVFLVSFHLRGRRPPVAVIILHGLIAVTAFMLLIIQATKVNG